MLYFVLVCFVIFGINFVCFFNLRETVQLNFFHNFTEILFILSILLLEEIIYRQIDFTFSNMTYQVAYDLFEIKQHLLNLKHDFSGVNQH